jgi:ParB family transcriptional regulator, chromosome partitioning protein
MTSASKTSRAAAGRPGGSGRDLGALLAARGVTPAVPEQPDHHPRRDDLTDRHAKLADIAPNPLNIRVIDPDSPKVQELATSIRLNGQLTSAAVVSRFAFVAIFPEYAEQVGDARYVQVNGGRRRAAVSVLERDGHIPPGEAGLDIAVKNDLAASRDAFVAATAEENIARQDYDPIEEARAVSLVVKEAGSQDAAARRFGRSPGWITQHLNLLKLAPPVQAALIAGDIPLRDVRQMHSLPESEQIAILAEMLAARNSATVPTDPPATAGSPEPAEPPQSPEVPDTSPADTPRLRASRVVAAIRRLGDTPSKIADSLVGEMPAEAVQELIAELEARLRSE